MTARLAAGDAQTGLTARTTPFNEPE